MESNHAKRPLAAVIAGVFLVSACATNPDGSYKFDDRATGALLGAIAGCAIGAAAKGSKGCATGAVVGAAAGFLIGWYFESRKIASADQINAEYAKQAKTPGAKTALVPKNDVVPAKFNSTVVAKPADGEGQKEVEITSTTDLVGYGDKVPNVQQKYAIYDENNNLVEEKTEQIAAVDGAGRFETSSKFKLPADAKDKNYTVKTALVADNKTYKENAYKVSMHGDGTILLAALH